MDITPVYELRERLKVGAVAGTGLVVQDFRLKRAVEALAPLMAASPVFARLGQLAGKVLEENCPDRAGALLDAITLADALLCTQGKVEVSGELEMILPEGKGEEQAPVVNVPHSVLSTLLDALRHSGGGRYSYVTDLRKERPELFQDYRIRAAMVEALGASYAELAEAVAGWLVEDGRSGDILPLLKKGFDPKGKKEMVRRVQVMERIAGDAANSFYLEQLPQAEKEVKGALIYALRHSGENEECLLHLAATERGNNQKMACCALSWMEGAETWKYFEAMAEKKPAEAVSFLELSKRPEAEALTARVFCQTIRKWQEEGGKPRKEMEPILEACIQSLLGKHGPGACECYRLAAAVGTGLDCPVENGKDGREIMTFTLPETRFRVKKSYFSQAIPRALQLGVLLCPEGEGGELKILADELYQACKDPYFPAAMSAALRAGKSEESLALLSGFVSEKQLFGKKIRKDRAGLVRQALESVTVDASGTGYVITAALASAAEFQPREVLWQISAPAEGMFELLMDLEDTGTDMVLASWIRPGDSAMCSRLADYFHKRALETEDNRIYLEPMRRCGAQDCSHMAVKYFSRNKNRIYNWQVENYLEQMPGSPGSRLQEAERLLEQLKTGELKAIKGWNATTPVETFIQSMKFAVSQEEKDGQGEKGV